MKKKFITILSLLLAFVLCFALVACGGDTDSSSGDKDPIGAVDPDKKPSDDDETDPDKKPSDDDESEVKPLPGVPVSIKYSDVLGAVNSVMTAEGFTGTASYKASSKNRETVADSFALDKRGSKVKAVADDKEYIVDISTGYFYSKTEGGYVFEQKIYAGNVECLQSIIAGVTNVNDENVTVMYDEKTNTVAYSVDVAGKVNTYLEPLYSAYSKNKTLGELLNDYCKMLFNKSFDEVFDAVWKVIPDPDYTVGKAFSIIKDKTDIDVEQVLKLSGIEISEETMAAVKSRTLGEAVLGAYNYIKDNSITFPQEDTEVDPADMTNFGKGLLNAILFDKIDMTNAKAELEVIKASMAALKYSKVKLLINSLLALSEKTADLRTAIVNGVTLNKATYTLIVKLDDDKKIKCVTVEGFIQHSYTGKATEGIFADNDYHAQLEFNIDEYKKSPAEFDIKFNPAYNYKMPVAKYVYAVTDKDISVYYETAGKEVKVTSFTLRKETPDGVSEQVKDAASGAFKFDKQTSSFVFDAALLKSVLKDAPANTKLTAIVYFDDDEVGYAVTLVYLNNDPEAFYGNVLDSVVDFAKTVAAKHAEKK